MSIKKVINGCVAMSLSIIAASVSAKNIEADVAFSSDYVFRGFSQTNENPSVSGGMTYSADNGVYFGAWGSNVDFGAPASMELDFYAGYAFDLNDNIGLDVSYIHYVYPGETSELNYSEFVSSLSVHGFKFGLVFSPDYFGSDHGAVITSADYSIGLIEGVSLGLHVGYTDVSDAKNFFAPRENSYLEYSVGLSANAVGVDFALIYHATDLNGVDVADDRLVLSIGKSF